MFRTVTLQASITLRYWLQPSICLSWIETQDPCFDKKKQFQLSKLPSYLLDQLFPIYFQKFNNVVQMGKVHFQGALLISMNMTLLRFVPCILLLLLLHLGCYHLEFCPHILDQLGLGLLDLPGEIQIERMIFLQNSS